MRTTLRNLVESESGDSVVAFLRARGPRACVIAPGWLRQRIMGERQSGRHSAVWVEDWENDSTPADGVTNFIVAAEDAPREKALLGALSRLDGVKAYGLFGHVLPALLSAMNGMAPGHTTKGLKRFAIVCVPRSGSRYLSALLSRRGVGAPREHIREPMAHIIAEGNMGFGPAVESLERFGQRNGIFGTKLISTFLVHASHRRVAELKQNIEWMVDRGYHLVRLERPVEEAAVSSYIAFQMQKWHFFGEMDEDARARLNSLEFEDGAAWDEFIRFRAEKVIIDSLARWFDMPSIAYADIETDADLIVSRLCELIGADPAALKPGSAPIPIATRNESPTYAVFAQRMAALLERRAADIVPSTARKLRAIGKLSQSEAEELVAGSG
ncbi:MAG: hypothetical protein ABSD74_12405 [Rhizomicrobium sp.]|jgi:LPS sulfotransferase NodH